jgi:hypothetical protein
MIPRHLVSTSSLTDTHTTTTSHNDSIGNIDSTLMHPSVSDIQDSGGLMMSEETTKLKLDRNNLENQMGCGDHAFEWSNPPGIDSAYGSGNTQDPTDLEGNFSQDLPVPHNRSSLHISRPEDKVALTMYTTGGDSEDGGVSYYQEFVTFPDSEDQN